MRQRIWKRSAPPQLVRGKIALIRSGRRPFGAARSLQGLFMTDLLQGVIGLSHPVSAVPIDGGWVGIDSRGDLQLAERLIAEGRLGPA